MAKRDAFIQIALIWKWRDPNPFVLNLMAVKHASSLASESHQAIAKLFPFPTDTIPFAEKKYKVLPTEGVENENKQFGIDLIWLEGKKSGPWCLLPGQKCKGSHVVNETLEFLQDTCEDE